MGCRDPRHECATRASCSSVLWRLAGERLSTLRPGDSAPRLYVDSLNDMIDHQTVRLSGLNNRVPDAVLWLELVGAALALGLLALYLGVLGKGLFPILGAAVIVSFLVLVTFDLDRPTRGLIQVPATPLLAEKATMSSAARRPRHRADCGARTPTRAGATAAGPSLSAEAAVESLILATSSRPSTVAPSESSSTLAGWSRGA